jgi:hypothetical protein
VEPAMLQRTVGSMIVTSPPVLRFVETLTLGVVPGFSEQSVIAMTGSVSVQLVKVRLVSVPVIADALLFDVKVAWKFV